MKIPIICDGLLDQKYHIGDDPVGHKCTRPAICKICGRVYLCERCKELFILADPRLTLPGDPD